MLTTGIAIKCPKDTYARIAPRSRLTFKNSLHTMAGVIDPDYRGELKILLHNFGATSQAIQPGTKIAQLILERALITDVEEVNELNSTSRQKQGFGSTEKRMTRSMTSRIVTELPILPKSSPLFDSTTAKAAKLYSDFLTTFENPLNIALTDDIMDNRTHMIVDIKSSDKDPLLGMIIVDKNVFNRPQLTDCKKGGSMIQIPRWRSKLKNGFITHINDIEVTNKNDIKQAIAKARLFGDTSIKMNFATVTKQAMHPQFGIPQLYHNQMNIIGQHLWDIAHDNCYRDDTEEIVIPIGKNKLKTIMKEIKPVKGYLRRCHKLWSHLRSLPNWYKLAAVKRAKKTKLTRRLLLNQDDWEDWHKSEFKQLDQYHEQGTFGPPTQLPIGANVLDLLWTYLIKDYGTKKARCVCNGNPKINGSVTLGNTYAASLEQTGARIFWAATALFNYITIGADASNAFAEAPAPRAPLFVRIDQQYREWYINKYPNKPQPRKNDVLRVNGALQGHPESARLWALLIDKVIRDLNLRPCTHELCLYYTDDYNGTDKKILFLRQVDDFAIKCEDKQTAMYVIEQMNSKMTITVKELGIINRFNGVDVLQSRHYIKLYNTTYIEKMLERHHWLKEDNYHMPTHPTKMYHDNSYLRSLETTTIPTDKEIKSLEREMGFGYRQAIGELIYALVTCRPDISIAVMKLAQYSTKPQRIHFEAIKQIH